MSTISDVITSSRELLQDTVTPYRFSDDRLVRTLNGALREVFRIRPDLFLSASFVIPEYVEADLASPPNFPLEEQYYNTVVEFIVGWTELSDDEFTMDNRAAALLTAFRNQLIGSNILGGVR